MLVNLEKILFMISYIKAETLTEIAKAMLDRVSKSLKFARSYCAQYKLKYADDVFIHLKSKITFQHDSRDYEQFMRFQTFVNHNQHGSPYLGDCDDFTIAILACLIAIGYKDLYLTFAGNNKDSPSHVYCGVLNDKGELIPIDLTENQIGKERNYKYIVSIKILT